MSLATDTTATLQSFRTIQGAARAAFAEAEGDVALAEGALLRAASVDPMLLDFLLRKGAKAAIGEIERQENAALWHGGGAGKSEATRQPQERVQVRQDEGGATDDRAAMKRAAATALMMFKLPGGGVLGDAAPDETAAAAQAYLKPGTDMVQKGRWLEMIHARQGAKIVREALKETDLQELRSAAMGAVV